MNEHPHNGHPALLGAATAGALGFLKWAASVQSELNALMTLLGIAGAAIGLAVTIFRIGRSIHQWRKPR